MHVTLNSAGDFLGSRNAINVVMGKELSFSGGGAGVKHRLILQAFLDCVSQKDFSLENLKTLGDYIMSEIMK